MAVDNVVVLSFSSLPLVDKAISKLSLSSSKVLTTKVSGLESKIMALKVLVSLVLIADRFDGVWIFTSGVDSGDLGSGVTIIMDISLACHVCKISEATFKNKLSVSILGLYVGVSLLIWFFQAGKINFMIAKAVNESFFVILDGNFNKNGSHKCASFKKCFDFGLVNSFGGTNSYDVAKTINFLFISSNLVNAVVNCNMCSIGEFFNTDHWAVSVSVDLGGLLNIQLNFLCKQANRDQWKFNFKSADVNK
ncbi:hypothetical protein G9A89_014697 [Geosiphon pyriformis]|nr:hypothetical protein G9A89_014697 [Geosiphon pyriformis]